MRFKIIFDEDCPKSGNRRGPISIFLMRTVRNPGNRAFSLQFGEDLGSRAVVDAVVEVDHLLEAGLGGLGLGVDPIVAFFESEIIKRVMLSFWMRVLTWQRP